MSSEMAVSLGLVLTVYACAWAVAGGLIWRWTGIVLALEEGASQRYLCLDGLRGVLAIGVVCHHWIVTRSFLANARWEIPATPLATELGQGSVALFLMITSFLFWGRILDKGHRFGWGRFYVARLFRLVPLYVAALLLLIGVVLVETHGHLVERKLSLAGEMVDWLAFTVQRAPDLNGFPQTWHIVAGVTWSLRYEWAFYLALPILGCLFARVRQAGWIFFSLLGLGLFFLAAREQPLVCNIGLAFIGGVVGAYWIRTPELRDVGKQRWFGLFSLLCGASVFLICETAYAPLPLALLTVLFIAVVCDNPMFGWMSHAAARWIGEVSYGIYLFHGIFIWVVTRWMLPSLIEPSHLGPGLLLALAIALVIPLILFTSLLHHFIERPGIALGRRVIEKAQQFAAKKTSRAPQPVRTPTAVP